MPYTQNNIPFVKGSDTSEAAAIEYESAKANDLLRVHRCILNAPDGMTCDEVEEFLNMKHQTASARIRDLVLNGLVFDTKARRKIRSGRSARVYGAHKNA